MRRILNKVRTRGTKSLAGARLQGGPHSAAATGLPPTLWKRPAGSQQLHSWLFLRRTLNLADEFHGCLLKPTCFINRTDPEEMAGRKVIQFLVIDHRQQVFLLL